ncbi:MAG TPA: zinc ribbon domain-containing protein [Pyrinomonadaceae bacterium]|nr:zinc ribbon domain-containing protein [Pyrinomonadaceae bacterium]
MKQCPQCKEQFSDEQNFCDSDGTPLLDDTAMLRAALSAHLPDAEVLPQPQAYDPAARSLWPMVTIGVLIGVILCLGAYVVMLTMSSKEAANNQRPETAKLSTSTRSTQPAPIRPEALPAATVEEPAEEAAEESPSPTPAEVAQVPTQEASASLNHGPISTNRQDGEKRGRMIIKLKSGVQVEADAAWEDQLGIWYRQGGLVSHVERDRIESIGEPPRPKSSPTDEKP